jgi:hypothetical protein
MCRRTHRGQRLRLAMRPARAAAKDRAPRMNKDSPESNGLRTVRSMKQRLPIGTKNRSCRNSDGDPGVLDSHRNGAGDDAREAQQYMERNDRQKYGRCRWHLNTGHVGHVPRPRSLSTIGSLASAPISFCVHRSTYKPPRNISAVGWAITSSTICRLSSDFDEIAFQSFRERLRRGGFLAEL